MYDGRPANGTPNFRSGVIDVNRSNGYHTGLEDVRNPYLNFMFGSRGLTLGNICDTVVRGCKLGTQLNERAFLDPMLRADAPSLVAQLTHFGTWPTVFVLTREITMRIPYWGLAYRIVMGGDQVSASDCVNGDCSNPGRDYSR